MQSLRGTGTGAGAAAPPLHPSVESHLKTELVLLDTLRRRSKAQHRSQVFMTRLEGVLRLGRLVYASLARCQVAAGGKDLSKGGSGQRPPVQIDTKDIRRLRVLVDKMTQALFTATIASDQIVQLYFFLPLHTLLLAIYGRLYTLCENIKAWADEGSHEPIRQESSAAKVEEEITAVLLDVPDELGEKIDRGSVVPSTGHTSQPTPVPSFVEGKETSPVPPVKPDPPTAVMAVEPEDTATTPTAPTVPAEVEVSVKSAKAKAKAKKRKRDAMDDIFGF